MAISYKEHRIGNNEVTEITLVNKNQMKVSFLNLGGIITEISVPDLNGNFDNVVLAHDDYEDYLENKGYLGAIIGRTAGRIKDAKFTLHEIEYTLAKNYGKNSGHGGARGFDKQIFDFKAYLDGNQVTLMYVSKHMEEGYPGNAQIEVTYGLNDENEFSIDYKAMSDEDTLMNLTNHTYFNLSGDFKESILYHEMFIAADEFAQLHKDSTVSGKLLPVAGSPFDFRYHHEIGEEINEVHDQIEIGQGYDHPFVLRDDDKVKIRLLHRFTGRVLEIKTNHDAVVIYSQNYTDNQVVNGGLELERRKAIAIETQSLPIGPKDINIQSSMLKAHEVYQKKTIYHFSVEDLPDIQELLK